MSARRFGRSARSSAERVSVASRSRWKFWNVSAELRRSAKISFRTCVCTLRRTTSKLVQVSADEISSMDSRNFVRNRSLVTRHPPQLQRNRRKLPQRLYASAYEFVPYAMHGTEMHRIRRVLL